MDEQLYAFMTEVAALHKVLHDAGAAIAAAAGLTYGQLTCLRQVADEPRTVASMAAIQGLARQGVQRTADSSVADRLATWRDNPRHRRAKLLAVSTRGRRALSTAARAHLTWVEQLGTKMPGDLQGLTTRLAVVRELVAGDHA